MTTLIQGPTEPTKSMRCVTGAGPKGGITNYKGGSCDPLRNHAFHMLPSLA